MQNSTRVGLIVGGSSGIGLAVARRWVDDGLTVIIAGRDFAKAQTAAERLGPSAHALACDVADPASLAAMFALVESRWGRLDVAVNSAAIAARPAPLTDVALSEVDALLATDVRGPLLCLQHEMALMRRHGGGSIVNVASVNGLSGVASAALYSAGRHAVVGLTRSVAREAIAEGIRINAVCPGATDTPRRHARMASLSEADQATVTAQLAATIPIGRIAHADEIAQAITWLASPAASYVVGHCLVVDGGLMA